MTAASLPGVDWGQARAALGEEEERLAALVRSIRKPEAHAVGQWTVGDVAMHLTQGLLIVPGLARGDMADVHRFLPALAERPSLSPLGDVWELGDLTMVGVGADPERDPAVLADRIETRAAAFLDEAGNHTADERRAWLVEGTSLPLPVFTCHLLNEAIMHGHDIAKAEGRPWPIKPAHAALVFDGFIWPVIAALGPRSMVNQDKAAGVRATYDIRVRHGNRYHFVFDDGALSIEPASSRRVDCHIVADPVAFLMVAYARQSQWEAIAKGKLLAWGRKPWLGPRLRSLMRNP